MSGLEHRGLIAAQDRWPHGVRARYAAGCRCVKCRHANRVYARERYRAVRRGDRRELVPAERARRHILKLSRSGVGRDTVAAAAGVCITTVAAIRTGAKQRIRASTERAILAVGVWAARGSTRVPAGPTWQRIAWLLEEGFTRTRIARELGYATRALQLGREWITAENARRVERLYRTYAA